MLMSSSHNDVVSNISSMRRNFSSSPDETLRRELSSGVFLTNFEVFHLVMKNTVWNTGYYLSNKMILEGEIEDAKSQSFF